MRPATRFLAVWAAVLTGLLVLAGGVNLAVDPYEVFGWTRVTGVNALKPATRNHTALAKTWQIARARPATVVLGTSRAYLGVDAGSAVWPDSYRPVYNYGLPGTNMRRSLLRELREAWTTGQVKRVVAFLDFPSFFIPDPPSRGDEDERRLHVLDTGAPNPSWRAQRRLDLFLSTMTFSALSDSVVTVLSQHRGARTLDLRPDGTAADADFANAAHAEGMNALFAQKDIELIEAAEQMRTILADWKGPLPNTSLIREMIEFCRDRDIELVLILESSHADMLELFRRAGLWPRVEELKVQLAGFVAEARYAKASVWDFVEYAEAAVEAVPPRGDRTTPTRWFWEPAHFKKPLGDLMLRRVFTGAPAEYGALLTPETVEARNRAVRETQAAFPNWRLACEGPGQGACIYTNRP